MIIGTGIDIIELERIEKLMNRQPGFVERVLTHDERTQFQGLGEKRKVEFISIHDRSARDNPKNQPPSPILELSQIDPLQSEQVIRPPTPPPPKEVVTRRQALETLKSYLLTPQKKFFRASLSKDEAIPVFFSSELLGGLTEHEQLRLFMEAEKVG